MRGFTAAYAARTRKQAMGDDLTAARRFCDTVRRDMSQLIDNVSAQPCASADVLIGSLDNIQSGAKQLKARAIFRAAQTVVNAVNDRAPLPTLQGRILSLNKLFTQYEGGLDDIAPRPANGEGVEDDIPSYPARAQDDDLEARYMKAREALAPLMGLTQTKSESDSLVKLAGFSQDEIKGRLSREKMAAHDRAHGSDTVLEPLLNDYPDLPDISEMSLGDNIAAPLFTQPASLQSIRQIDTARQIDFETLMPEFISQALQEARQNDKTVSVSYAAEGVNFARNQLPAFKSLLSHIAAILVGSVLERPEARRSRGLSGAGHIAITATQTPSEIVISVECPGTALAAGAYIPAGRSVEGLVIMPGQYAKEGHAHIVLTAPRRLRLSSDAVSLSPTSTEMAL